jgi:hypothetical protein
MNVTRTRLLPCTLLLIILTFLASNTAFAQYAGGDSTEDVPWQITTVEQLQSIADNPDAHFILTADIDASSTAGWNDGLGFEPIGNSNNRFSGSLGGNGFSITGLTINRESQNNTGLFGVIQNGTLQNITLIDAEITGRNYTGGLAGTMSGGIIEQSSVTGFISGENYVGGLTGSVYQGTIRTSFSDASISGIYSVGGIVGSMEDAEIAHSYSLSDIAGEAEVGGLAGSVFAIYGYDSDDTLGMINGSFAAGLVEGEQETGGLIGSVIWIVLTKSDKNQPDPRLSDIKITNTNSLVASYWDSVATSQPFAIGSDHRWEGFVVDTVGLESSQMTGQNAYIYMLEFDFNETWQLTTGYPVLSWQDADDTVEIPEVPRIVAESSAIEFGTSGIGIQKTIEFSIENTGIADLLIDVSVSGPDESRFMIDDSDQSLTIYPNATISIPVHFTAESGNAVQAELMVEHNASNQETPLVMSLSGEGKAVDFAGGSGTANDPWQIETLDQLDDVRLILQDYYILVNDLDASETSQWNNGEGFIPIGNSETGFSGSFNGNDYEIHGLFINRSATYGVGLFGFMDQGIIERVNLKKVQITGGPYTGSLVGFKRGGTIMHSHADGTVQGTDTYTGGFIGYQRGGEVQNISSSVNVTGLDYTGGLIGFNAATVTDSWASGSVTGHDEIGGLAGRNGYAPPLEGYISRSYATGDATGQNRVGGLSGSHQNGKIENVFTTGDVSGETTVGGLIGYGFEPVVNAFAAGSVEGESKIGGIAGSLGISSLSSVYWDKDVSGVTNATGSSSSEGITGSTTIEMQQQSTYEGWDFDETWAITEGETYPYLQQLGLPVSNEVESQPGEVPRTAVLHQNYPNPFNPVTVISYQLPKSRDVTLEVFDVTGRRVAVLVDELRAAGQNRVTFDASGLSSGVYIYRLRAGELIRTRKMILVK